MASNSTNGNGSQLLVVGETGGVTLIDPSTPLRRLNYFDGKFLRASDFDLEQSYLRQLVAISNQGLGPGVVYGYDTTLGSGDTIQIGPGLAIDPSGKVLLMQGTVSQSIQALIDASKKSAATAPDASGKSGAGTFNDCIEVAAPPPTTVIAVSDIYVIAICSAEALCGQADVYGKLCEEACVTTTDRPYRLDGIVLRAIPLQLVTPFPTSKTIAIDSHIYLRSKVAHSWYADELLKHPNSISRDGLLSATWCLGAGYDHGCCEVPLAVVARGGSTTVFLDAWIVRRERMEAPARRYWQWKMMMRPWDVFLAQILQFQCQLAELLSGVLTPGSRATDPCATERRTLGEAAALIEELKAGLTSYRSAISRASVAAQPALMSLSLTRISDLREKIATVLKSAGTAAQPTDRILIRGGLIELPPAGYLPVMNGTSVSVNDQVRALLGDGLDLRFCIATADYIAHEIEKAQHMDRISLLQGIDDPSNKPHVDIIVPDGKIASDTTTPAAGLYDAIASGSNNKTGLVYQGAGREESIGSAGTALYVAAAGVSQLAAAYFGGITTALANKTLTLDKVALQPDLQTNQFVARTMASTTAANFTARVANTAAAARAFTAGMKPPTGSSQPASGEAVAPPGSDSVDGLWLTARTEKKIKDLTVGTQTPVSARVLIGSHPRLPTAFELMLSGNLSIDQVSAVAGGGPNLSGTLDGMITLGVFRADPANQRETEILFTQHINMGAALAYSGDDQEGSIVLTLTPASTSTTSATSFILTKTYSGTAHLTYDVSVSETTQSSTNTASLAKLDLMADLDVVNPANTFHGYAVNGLDIVQAAVIETEPSFERRAEAELFPSLPPATSELVIQAVRDWVMFTKRREEQCAREVVPLPPPPPRSYRVINLSGSPDQAQAIFADLTLNLQRPTTLASLLNRLIKDSGEMILVVKFAGDSATMLSDAGTAKSDWEAFNPGNTIYLAAAGASGETDNSLQKNRIKTFEGAISADSVEDPSAQELAILPFPAGVNLGGADGLMLLVTAMQRTDLLVVTTNGVPSPTSQNAKVTFANAQPQGTALTDFIAGLPSSLGKFTGVTLYTTGALDSNAGARVQVIFDALNAASRINNTQVTPQTGVLSATQQAALTSAPPAGAGFSLTGIDDVVYLDILESFVARTRR